MKVRIRGRQLQFVEFTPKEIAWVDKTLSWEGHPEKVKIMKPDGTEGEESRVPIDRLLFKDGDIYWTYFGLYEILAEKWGKDMELIDPEPAPDYQRCKIDKDMFANAPEPIELMDFQVAAIQKAVMLKIGITEIPTSGGKTEIILGVLRHLFKEGLIKKVLIVVPDNGLCSQFHERALMRGFSLNEIGMLSGKYKQYDHPITVAVVNTIAEGLKQNKPKIVDLVRTADLVGYDEVHHLKAATWVNIANNAIMADYLLGWSGSPLHSKDVLESSGDALIMGLMGRIIFTETYQHLLEIGLISQAVVFMKNVPGMYAKYMASFNYIYDKYVVSNDQRNSYIVEYAKLFASMNFSVLVLVQRREHALKLMQATMEFSPVCVFGGNKGMKPDDKGGIEDWDYDFNIFRKHFEQGHYKIVFASQVMDEGKDIPNIGCVIMAGGGKSPIKMTQRLGRGLRRKKFGLNRVYIVDFNDRTHVFLNSHSKKRKDFYQSAESVMIEDHYQFMNLAYSHSQQILALEAELTKAT